MPIKHSDRRDLPGASVLLAKVDLKVEGGLGIKCRSGLSKEPTQTRTMVRMSCSSLRLRASLPMLSGVATAKFARQSPQPVVRVAEGVVLESRRRRPTEHRKDSWCSSRTLAVPPYNQPP